MQSSLGDSRQCAGSLRNDCPWLRDAGWERGWVQGRLKTAEICSFSSLDCQPLRCRTHSRGLTQHRLLCVKQTESVPNVFTLPSHYQTIPQTNCPVFALFQAESGGVHAGRAVSWKAWGMPGGRGARVSWTQSPEDSAGQQCPREATFLHVFQAE